MELQARTSGSGAILSDVFRQNPWCFPDFSWGMIYKRQVKFICVDSPPGLF